MKKLVLLIVITMFAAAMFGCSGVNSVQTQNGTPVDDNKDNTNVIVDPGKPEPPKDLPDTIKIKYQLEGMQEEREAYLNKSRQGFNIYLLKGYTMEEADDEAKDKTNIVMDYDKEFYAEITVLKEDADIEARAKEIKDNLKGFGDVEELNPKDHFDPYFQNSAYYIHASRPNYGSKLIMIQKVDGHWLQYELNLPSKEAAEGAGPALWAMLKTIRF